MSDAFYDPLIERTPRLGSCHVDSYWRQQVSNTEYPALSGSQHSQVAIIGAGFTGLSCAIALRQRGYDVTLVDASQPGWGCSGRNGGFVLPGTGRLSFAQMINTWGADKAREIYAEFRAGIELTEQHIRVANIDCDLQRSGYLKLAHKASKVADLQAQVTLLQTQFNDPVEFVNQQQIQQRFLRSREGHAGVYFPYSFGLNPLKLAQGLAGYAQQLGARIVADSPVLQWQQTGNVHTLYTPQGTLQAEQVIIASNAYTGKQFHSMVDHRQLPVLSSVIVTEPLSPAQLAACGFMPGLLAMDTRALKYYYRLLPDNRLLFGGRGAISGKGAASDVYRSRLLTALKHQFPGLDALKVDYYWSGWVSVSLDDYPRIQFDAKQRIGYAMGYCGSGLSFSQLAGYRLAEALCGDELPPLPFYQSALKRFPFSPFRRLGLWGFYQWGRVQDAWL